MKFGMFFEHQLPRPWQPESEARLFRQALEQVELGDRLGIDYAWGQEHHFLEEYAHSSAPEVFLAAFSQRTERIRLGHGIVLMPPAYNAPVRVAERLATLDLVSGGRVEWGTGESSSRMELEGFGVSYVEKRAMWAEAVRETARMLCMDPYPGFHGRYFNLPARNVVPKPIQKPHPPLWVACSNRDTLRLAARLGVGALTFAFMDAREAKFWVDEYYETFQRACEPIGRAVNPNVAMLTDFMCHRHPDEARRRGLEGAQFFAFGLSHYYRTGMHQLGHTNIWEEFKKAPPPVHAGTGGIGSPQQIRENFERLEAAGVDQLILLQQAGNYAHEHVCESLALFAAEVLPEFKRRDQERMRRKAEMLGPAVEKALARIPPLEAAADLPVVEAYPLLVEQQGVHLSGLVQDRSVEPAALWRLHAGGVGSSRRSNKRGDS